jgi:outer membrane protein OmpA-like peptidoglycan-associated protein
MASLMVIFVLLLVTRLNNQAGMRAAMAGEVEKQIKSTMSEETRTQVGRDLRDPNTVVITVPEQLLSFDLQDATLKPAGVQYLSDHVRPWARVLCDASIRPNIDTVVVEGHSDATRWQGSTFEQSKEKNLALSQQRSMAVVSTSINLLSDVPEYRDCFLKTLSATGRGEEEPADPTVINSPKNRRVRFKIRLRPEISSEVARRLAEGN